MADTLNVFCSSVHVGTITYDAKDDSFTLTYTEEWRQNGFALSPCLPLEGSGDSASIKKFLSNLLPEGEGMEILSTHFHISKANTMGLTAAIGADTAGALLFTLEDSLEHMETTYRPIGVDELTERINARERKGLLIWDGKPRLSIAGVQDKLPVIVDDRGYGLGEGKLASTHILKFETLRQSHVVLNEYVCMKLAKAVKLNAADVSLERFGSNPVLVVKRFDRELVGPKEVRRRHIVDGCQVTDMPPGYKYERAFGSGEHVKDIRNGVTLPMLFKFAQKCKVPASATLSILQWSLFNLLICNADAHGKNISFYVDESGISVAPFYDMLDIAMYPEFDQSLAMAIGDEFEADGIREYQLAQMCDECGIKPMLLSQQLQKLANALLKAIKENDFSKITQNSEESKYIEELLTHIQKRTKEFREMAKEIPNIKL